MERINLNYDWLYSADFKNDYIKNNYDDSKFEKVNIPHTNIELPYNNFDETMFHFVSCYRKKIYVDKKLKGKILLLNFEAAASYAKVYVNEQLVMEHKGGYTGFSCDIAKFVKYGEENQIVVELDSSERDEIPPFGNVIDYLTYGGIYREVYIYVYEEDYIKNVFVKPFNVLHDSERKIKLEIEFNLNKEHQYQLELIDSKGNTSLNFDVKTEGISTIYEFKVPGEISLWDIDSPNLYTIKIKHQQSEYSYKFGFREAKFTSNGFYLNGRMLKIRGLNRHQCYPYVGYAMPESAQRKDAEFLKYDLGVNLVRTSHYPNSKHFLNACDEIGLLVFTEIPGWQHISKKEEWRDICLQHVQEMIYEGMNHPSIILWGVRINESGDDNKLYEKTNKLAHKLDETRQTGGVRCIPRSKLYEDVYTYNDFIHSGRKLRLLPKFFVTGKNPYLITEHNGHMFPTKSFDHEKKRQEHALRHARVLDEMYRKKNTSGAIGWCMSDYNTHKDFGSGDKICYHGVSDMFRINKLAAYTYKAQQDAEGVLEITSNMEIGDVAGGTTGDVYMLTNCDKVVLYKNGIKINEFDVKKMSKKAKGFKHIPHPPLILDDIIGNQLETAELPGGKTFSKADANRMKKILMKVKKIGAVGAIIRHLFTTLLLITKYNLKIDTITTLFGKYVTSWGAKQCSFKFVGYKDGKEVATTEKAAVSEIHLEAKADSLKLTEKDTYDVVRVVVRALSQTGNVLPYANDIIKLEIKGPGKIIGPTEISLVGGVKGFWVKTDGESGKIELNITSNTIKNKEKIVIDVEKI